ncbi:MAG: hypothetical protein ACK5LT_05150 [Lachnospirales bacterium]
MNELNRNHKDQFFKFMFTNPVYFKELYEIITNKKLEGDIRLFSDGIKLKDALISSAIENDVSFLTSDNRLLVMVEHQSSNNPNMAYRFGKYYFDALDKYINETGQNEYIDKVMKLPSADFIVLYNGEATLKTSGYNLNMNFSEPCEAIKINVMAKDINYKNLDIDIKNNKTILSFYSHLIENFRNGINVKTSIELAKKDGYNYEFLESEEWKNMAGTTYAAEIEINNRVRQAAEERAELMAQDMAQNMAQKLAQDMAHDMAQNMAQNMAKEIVTEKDKEIAFLKEQLKKLAG